MVSVDKTCIAVPPWVYNDIFSKSGYAAEAKTIQDLYLAGEKKAAEEAIPDEYLAKNSLIGDEGFVRERLHALKDSGVTALNALGTPAVYAAPREGYRGWHGAMCLSASASDEATDAAYRYMNWWLSGWAGAFVARQGYYVSIPELAKQHLSAPEWAYWYGGEPATAPLRGTDGRLVVQPGAVRNGGSYEERMSRIAVWNTFPEAYEYTLERWGELLHT